MLRPARWARLPMRHAIGNDVVLDTGQSADEGVRADPDELVDAGAAAQDGEIADRAMAGEHDVVGKDDVAADAAIMRDMGLRQEQAMIADAGDAPPPAVPGIHRDAFADRAIGADDEIVSSPRYLRSCGGCRERRRDRPGCARRSWSGRLRRRGSAA